MNFDDLVKRIADVGPQFNDYALRGFVKEHIDNSPEFLALVFKEGIKLIDADLEYMGYEILTPEDRVKFELRSGTPKSQKTKVPLTMSHLQLVRYKFRFGDQFVFTHLYTPYIFDDMLHIRGKRSIARKVILERTFSRVSEKDKDGLSVSPIRVNLVFNRRQSFRVQSYLSSQTSYSHFVVGGRLWHGKGKKNNRCERTIVHYLLAKFGFVKTLKRFGLSPNDVQFTTEVGTDIEQFEYFAARPYDPKDESGPGFFLKVNRTLLGDDQARKFIVNLLYVLHHSDVPTIDNVYVDETSGEFQTHLSPWKIILGMITVGNQDHPKAYSNAESHLRSVDYFIDPLTRKRFQTFGVEINDIYDLLVYIFSNIDWFMVNHQVQDLYNSRLDVSNGILVESFARKIFWNIYYLANKTNITLQDVQSAFRLNPMMFRMATSVRKDDAEHYIAPPEIIGDNFLLSGGLNKIRLGGRAEQRLHPSMLVAESINAFVGKYIGKTGYLNPYIPTDEHGAIEHPDYAHEIDEIMYYLPK